MKSQTRQAKLKETILLTLMGVIMYISQVTLSQLPNIELVSLLVIITTRRFGLKALCSIYIFVVCEVFTYGAELWVINYMYVWTVLCVISLVFKKLDNSLIFAFLSAIFGLCFGTLCSVPYFFVGGAAMGFSYIVAGLWFDIVHSIGNFVLTLLLYKPLTKALDNVINKYIYINCQW
ncbi:MAG: hypothetical protein ACOYJS_03995 [Acutalibacteraceae bacterium]